MSPSDIADDLPAPRDDEPSSLRQDIADELADHLNSAFLRELHSTRDETAATQNALDRFGDPRKIARKLWLDAMQEKIMSQRLTFVALLVVVLASAGSMGFAWFLVDQAREVNLMMMEQSRAANAALLQQSQESSQALAEQSRKTNEALVAKLAELSTATRPPAEAPRSMEWNSVKIRLYSGEKPARPAAGYTVTLVGYVLDTASRGTIVRKSDETGMVDLGLIRPGQHSLTVKTPWGEARADSRITVLPGQSFLEAIVCPASRAGESPVDFVIDWPEELKDQGLWTVAHFVPLPRTIDGQAWTITGHMEERVVVIGPDRSIIPFPIDPGIDYRGDQGTPQGPFRGKLMQRYDLEHDELRGLFSRSSQSVVVPRPIPKDRGGDGKKTMPAMIGQGWEYDFVFREAAAVPQVSFLDATYRLETLLLTKPPVALDVTRDPELRSPNDTAGGVNLQRFADLRVLVVQGGLVPPPSMSMRGEGPVQVSNPHVPITDWVETVGRPTDAAQRLAQQPTFTAKSEGVNHWKIPVPVRLVERVRSTKDFLVLMEEAASAAAPKLE